MNNIPHIVNINSKTTNCKSLNSEEYLFKITKLNKLKI
jgi:hypothetical protein